MYHLSPVLYANIFSYLIFYPWAGSFIRILVGGLGAINLNITFPELGRQLVKTFSPSDIIPTYIVVLSYSYLSGMGGGLYFLNISSIHFHVIDIDNFLNSKVFQSTFFSGLNSLPVMNFYPKQL